MHITFHPLSVANIARNSCHNRYETWLQNVTSKTIQEASCNLSEYWYIRYYCFICIHIYSQRIMYKCIIMVSYVQRYTHAYIAKKRRKKLILVMWTRCELQRGLTSVSFHWSFLHSSPRTAFIISQNVHSPFAGFPDASSSTSCLLRTHSTFGTPSRRNWCI